MHSQLVVVGGGPGGYSAAFRAADLGMTVTLVEQDARLGGTCLLRGCIPSKSLLHWTELIPHTRDAMEWGLAFERPRIDLAMLRDRTAQAIAALTGGLTQLAKQRKVRVVNARASFINSQTLQLSGGDAKTYDDPQLTFDQCILATGSRPSAPKALSLDSPQMMDSTGALALEELPESLLVVGGGYIGLELGTVYANLGSAVTVVELTDGLLPGVDRDLVRPLAKRLERQLAAIELSTTVTAIEQAGNALDVTLVPANGGPQCGESPTTEIRVERFDRVLVSVGRQPCSDNLGLENTRVRVDERGFVGTDAHCRTADPKILAIGDLVGQPMLAHKAMHEGKVAAEVAAGQDAAFEPRAIPAVVFTDPQIAWAGVTEEEARLQGLDIKVSRYPWAACGRAQGIGRTEGLTKMILHAPSNRVLGVGIVGADAGDLIAEAVLAIEMGATAGDFALSIHPHPTLGETLSGAAEAHLGLATEIYRPQRPPRGSGNP